MPRIALKRREPLVKFVRRAARGHLDAAERALRAGANGGKRTRSHAAQARRELLRLRALLQLVRGPLGTTAYGREHGAVQRLVRRITPHAAAHDTATTEALAAFASPSGKAPGKAPGKDAKAPAAAGPALLRALADVAEIRVRAAHWHLPEAGFDALAPALRLVWRQSARPVNHGPQATKSALAPAALAQAALTLHDQLRCLERMWPDAMDAPRRLARGLAADATRLAALDTLAAAANAPDDRWRKRLAQAQAQTAAQVNAAAALLAAETPAAFTRRAAAYWDQWRGPQG